MPRMMMIGPASFASSDNSCSSRPCTINSAAQRLQDNTRDGVAVRDIETIAKLKSG